MLLVDPVGIEARYVVAWLAAGSFSLAGRYAFDLLASLIYGADGDAPPALLLGARKSCSSALAVLAALAPADRVRVAGLVAPGSELESEGDTGTTPPVVASYEHLAEALSATGVTQVILADPASLNGQLQGVMDTCRLAGVTLKAVSLNLNEHPEAVAYIPGLDCPLFVVRPAGGRRELPGQASRGPRWFCLLLFVLSPLILAVAALIKLTSPGQIFFVQERIGVGQQPFRFYKFRTMVANARESQGTLEEINEADGVLFKVRDDPRVTGVGRVLRRFSLDEYRSCSTCSAAT